MFIYKQIYLTIIVYIIFYLKKRLIISSLIGLNNLRDTGHRFESNIHFFDGLLEASNWFEITQE